MGKTISESKCKRLLIRKLLLWAEKAMNANNGAFLFCIGQFSRKFLILNSLEMKDEQKNDDTRFFLWSLTKKSQFGRLVDVL